MNVFGKEPAVVLGALAEVIRAIIPFLLVFGFVNWTDPQIGAVIFMVGVIIGFLNVLLTRSQVYSPASTQVGLRMPSGSSLALLDSVLETGVTVNAGDTHSQVVNKVEKAEEKKSL